MLNKKELTLKEKLYFPSIFQGLMVTGKVFLSNLWTFIRGRRGARTVYYPEETRPDYAQNFRGSHVLPLLESGRLRCIACKLCEIHCPARCIVIEAAPSPEGDTYAPKIPTQFDIDYSRCVFCGYCVEVCPKDAILMPSRKKAGPTPNRKELLLTIDDLREGNKP